MQSNLAVDDVKNAAPAKLKRSAGWLAVMIRPHKSRVCLPFQNTPIVLAVDERIRMFFPGWKRAKQVGKMIANGLLSVEQLAPGIEELGLR